MQYILRSIQNANDDIFAVKMDIEIEARRYVDHLCENGADETVEPDPDRDNIDSLPEWFDAEKYKRYA